jgi:NADH:ubiquinone oxidoreductase subunit 6 (subunit J)
VLPALAIVVVVFAVMVKAFGTAAWRTAELPADTTSTYAVGNALLGTYVLPFEVASLVLLAVLVGVVVLSRKEADPVSGRTE